MADAPKNQNMKWVFLALGCGGLLLVGTAVLGILAAIAIPSFIKFQQRAKIAEATILVDKIARNAVEHYGEHCVFPPSAQPSSPMPSGGEKVFPVNFTGRGWDELKLFETAPKYFMYETANEANEFVVWARADFNPGPPHHTVSLRVTGDPEACTAGLQSPVTENELE